MIPVAEFNKVGSILLMVVVYKHETIYLRSHMDYMIYPIPMYVYEPTLFKAVKLACVVE